MVRVMKLIEFGDDGVLRGILQNPGKGSPQGVVFVGGFERLGTAEPKFRDLSNLLYDSGVPSLRFDFSGLGLSEGEFKGSTLDRWVHELGQAYDALVSHTGISDVYIVAHSLGACIAGKLIEERPESIRGGVLIAPALNQRDLMRYWFVTSQNKKNPNVEVSWNNYKGLLDEDAFQSDCNNPDKASKFNIIGSAYFIGSNSKDYSDLFHGLENSFLHVHGSKDAAVPLESVSVKFKERLIVSGGDHDLEKFDHRTTWTKSALDYLLRSKD
jgi:pimeloyl-ACP methyl ester carboxylesterase